MTIPTSASVADIMESVIIKGDLSKLTQGERVTYYSKVCESLGLNPLTRPFEYIVLNGKLTLYALRACSDQLRKIHQVSLEIVSRDVTDDVLTIHVKARMPDGRVDEDLGSVAFPASLKGENRANAELKAVTKAKRRATLSICGLGWLDETEIADIATAVRRPPPPAANPILPAHDPETGEILSPDDSPPPATAAPPVVPPHNNAGGAASHDDIHDHIRMATDAMVLREWWNSPEQKMARRDLNEIQLKDLMSFCVARINALKQEGQAS